MSVLAQRPIHQALRHARIDSISVSTMDNNCYLITDLPSGQRILIDAADDPPALLALLDRVPGIGLSQIVTTHAHWDHVRALPEIAAATGATVSVGAADVAALPEIASPVHALEHGDTIDVGSLRLEVIGLRGHTPGSIALAMTEGLDDDQPGRVHLLTGDSLFPGGVGATGGDPRRFARLFADVSERVFARFDDRTIVYPGHGDPTTLGRERPHLPAWAARGW